jgi:predicted MPP superfamily phosphohydrolase
MTSSLLQEHSLAARLRRRIEIEQYYAALGRPCRRHEAFGYLERYCLKPLLRLGLKASGLYPRGVANALRLSVREIHFEFQNLPPAFNGFRILHLSDLHIDGVDGLAEIMAERVAVLRPDLCVITGDFRFRNEGSCERVYPRLELILSNISSDHGIYAILGNHDVSEIAFRLEEMGVQCLVNEAVAIKKGGESIWLAGVDDPYDFRCDDLSAALDAIPHESFKILLAHTPDLYREAAAAGVHLYLCGHTHGGQIRFPLLGALFHHAKAPRALVVGPWQHEQMYGYTSPGAGCSSLPVRFNCPPEITMIELAKAA